MGVTESPRIEELRRRVQKDPASIAFAQLAEELRRAGQYDDAVEVSLAGLGRHPAYLSARVTLGRSLMELGREDEAQSELELVLGLAPENLAAIRALAELHQRRGQADDEATDAEDARPVPDDVVAGPRLDAAVGRIAVAVRETQPAAEPPVRESSSAAASHAIAPLAFGEVATALDSARKDDEVRQPRAAFDAVFAPACDAGAGAVTEPGPADAAMAGSDQGLDRCVTVALHLVQPGGGFETDPALDELERWLSSIVADRAGGA